MDKIKYPLLIAASFLLAAFLYGNIDIADEANADWDLHQYIKIAQAAPDLDPTVKRPFAFRFLAHYVIGLIPLNVHYSYILINYTAILILLIVLYRFLLSREVPRSYAFLAVFMYIFNKHFIGYNMWNPYQINDILMNLIIIWFLYSLANRRFLGVAGALLVGSFVRETFLILIPVGFVFLFANDRRTKQIISFFVIALMAASIPYILRLLVPASNGDTLKGAFSVYAIYKLHTIKGVYHYFFNPWIPFSLIPFICFRETFGFIKDNIHLLFLLLGVYFSGFFGINVERLVHPAFIVFYSLLALIVMRRFGSRSQFTFLAIAAFLTSFHYIIGRFPLPSRNLTIVISGGTAVIVTIYVFWNKIKMSKSSVKSFASN